MNETTNTIAKLNENILTQIKNVNINFIDLVIFASSTVTTEHEDQSLFGQANGCMIHASRSAGNIRRPHHIVYGLLIPKDLQRNNDLTCRLLYSCVFPASNIPCFPYAFSRSTYQRIKIFYWRRWYFEAVKSFGAQAKVGIQPHFQDKSMTPHDPSPSSSL